LCFTGRRGGFEVAFERKVRALGVAVIHSRPRHPETLGKLERFHRTLKEWLADHPKANDVTECTS
jgi:transposase InsO family protein